MPSQAAARQPTPPALVLVDVGAVLDELADLEPEDLAELIWRPPPRRADVAA